MPAPTPARIVPFTLVRFETLDREHASPDLGPFDSVRVTATEVRGEPDGELIARRSGNGWRIPSEPDIEYVHVLVWDKESDLLTINLPHDEQAGLDALLERCRKVLPEVTYADIMRAAIYYASELTPEAIFESVQEIRRKDERRKLKKS